LDIYWNNRIPVVCVVLKFDITLNICTMNHKKNVQNDVAVLAGKVQVCEHEAIDGECSK
jgi:hypothetical protein